MHVLLATTGYPPEHAGAGGRLHQMYRRLAAADKSFSWSVLTKWRDLKSVAVDGPRKITAFARGDGEFPSLFEAMSESLWTLKQLQAGLLDSVDLVHAAGWSWTTPVLARAAKRRGIPFIRELTTMGDAGSSSFGGQLVRWTNRQADEIAAISPALAASARPYVSPATPIWCRPNGVDTALFRNADSGERAQRRAALQRSLPNLKPDSVVVLHVGRIRPLKNQLLLADSVAQLPPRFNLLLVGPAYRADSKYAAALRLRLAAPDLSSRAAFIEGNVPGIEQYMQAVDIFAFPSTSEGLGTVMIEALCCGLPVVASRLPGVTDWIVTEGVNGFFSSFSVNALSERLAGVAALIPKRPQIAAVAAKRFDQGVMDEGYRALFGRYGKVTAL